MQRRSDETLLSYLDNELDTADRAQVETWLDADAEARERLAALAQADDLVRHAFADAVNEPVPERLLAAARGQGGAPHEAEIVVLKRPQRPGRGPVWRWAGYAAAAGLFGLVLGGAGGYFGPGLLAPAPAGGKQVAATGNTWLENAAGYYKLSVGAGGSMLVDVAAGNDSREALQKVSQTISQQLRLPDLKPWGLNFQGARLVVVEGKPAAELVYTTDNKAIGPLTLLIGSSKQPDIQPTFDRRQDLNLLYWRHQGHAYVLTGQTDIGYLWGIANDVAWQLDAI